MTRPSQTISKLFVLHDREPSLGATPVTLEQARQYNKNGWGIFHAVNSFTGARRIENLTGISYWFADLDSGTKEEQLERLGKHLKPSRIVETRKGFHAYWKAKDATLGNWNRIVKWGLVPALEADPRATDPLRLLRVPGFYHNKAEPFLVRTVAQSDVAYTETQMIEAFPDRRVEVKVDAARRELGSPTFWGKVAQLSAREFLKRIDSHVLVQGERYKLMETTGGKANVLVMKPPTRGYVGTPCWVTADDRLAGVDGGSSPAAWLKWYGHSWSEIAEGLKTLFPELEEKE